MTILTELREEAALHPNCSRVKRLLTWAEIHFADSAERILELEDELKSEFKESEKLREALCQIKSGFELIGSFARDRAFRMPTDTFSRDFAGWINLMAGHGDPDYLKSNGQSVRHVDLRTKKPNKKKVKV